MYSDPRHWTLCVCVFCWLLDLCFFFCAVNKSLSFLKSKLTNHPRQHVVLFRIYFLCSHDHLFTFVSLHFCLRTLPLHLDPHLFFPCFPVYLNSYFPFPSFPSKFILPPFSLSLCRPSRVDLAHVSVPGDLEQNTSSAGAQCLRTKGGE